MTDTSKEAIIDSVKAEISMLDDSQTWFDCGDYVDDECGNVVCDGLSPEDARRIARVPEMERTIIALRAELDEAKAEIERLRDLMSLAHASMRACGWHLALGDDMAGDGVLQAAVVEIEEKYRQALKGTSDD